MWMEPALTGDRMTSDSNSTALPEAVAILPTRQNELHPSATKVRWPAVSPPAHPTGSTIGGLDVTPGRVYRALRRRRVPALLLAVVGASIAGYLANHLVSETYVARTQVYFPPTSNEARGDNVSFQRRQTALAKSRQILHAALENPSISEKYASADVNDVVGNLEKDIVADFKSSPDVMQITMKGSSPQDLVSLLNAVREAYLREGANKEVTDKTATLNWLRKLISEDQVKVAAARIEISDLVESLNCPDVATLRLRDDTQRTHRNSLQSLRFQHEVRKNGLLQTKKELQTNPPEPVAEPEVRPADLKAAIELALTKDKVMETLKASIPLLDAQIQLINKVKAEGTNPPSLAEKQKALDEAKAALVAREATIRETVGRRDARKSQTGAEVREEGLRQSPPGLEVTS